MYVRNFNLDPFADLVKLLGNVTTRADSLQTNQQIESDPAWIPSVDISEDDKSYKVSADLPQVDKESIKVSMKDGQLVIKGERKREITDAKHHRTERIYGNFFRSFTLPEDADESTVEAKLVDGVLNVTIAKAEPKEVKAIEVKVN